MKKIKMTFIQSLKATHGIQNKTRVEFNKSTSVILCHIPNSLVQRRSGCILFLPYSYAATLVTYSPTVAKHDDFHSKSLFLVKNKGQWNAKSGPKAAYGKNPKPNHE